MRRDRLIAGIVFGALAGATLPGVVRAVERAAVDPALRPALELGYSLLRCAVVLAFLVFVLVRSPARRPARDPLAVVVCAVAIGAAVGLAGPGDSRQPALVFAGELVTVASCIWLLISVLALGKCFGVLPEARGLVTAGPYAVVRHPVYLGEIGAYGGLVAAAPGPPNLFLFVAFLAAQTVRMRLEERALMREFPEYASYAKTVPRLVPVIRPLYAGKALPGDPS